MGRNFFPFPYSACFWDTERGDPSPKRWPGTHLVKWALVRGENKTLEMQRKKE